MTINKVCGSGMKAVMLAAQAIKLGDSKIVVAGGMESMSNAPYALDKARTGYRMGNGTLIDTMIHDGLWDPYNNVHMGNCGDCTAAEFNISREELDAYATESYKRAMAAQQSCRLSSEIVPVEIVAEIKKAVEHEGIFPKLSWHFDEKRGAFFYTSNDHEKLFARAKDQYDGAQPSGNSVAAANLVRLWQKTGDDRYAKLAEKSFKALAGPLKAQPASLTGLAYALALYLDAKKG